MMDWLREIFWLFQLVMAFQTVIPVALGGILSALAATRISNKWLRTITLIGIVIIQAVGSLSVFLKSGIDTLAWLIPIWFKYPYVNMGSLLFFWIPVTAQLLYVTKKSSPKVWLAALIGLLAVATGAIFLVIIGVAVGAETD